MILPLKEYSAKVLNIAIGWHLKTNEFDLFYLSLK